MELVGGGYHRSGDRQVVDDVSGANFPQHVSRLFECYLAAVTTGQDHDLARELFEVRNLTHTPTVDRRSMRYPSGKLANVGN